MESDRSTKIKEQVVKKILQYCNLKLENALDKWRENTKLMILNEKLDLEKKKYFIANLQNFLAQSNKRKLRNILLKFNKNAIISR